MKAVLSAILFLGVGLPSQAQNRPDMSVTATRQLETIVVTARKRGAESLQSVPESISAFSSEQIRDFALSDARDFVRLVPSLSYLDNGPGQGKLVLRGVSTGFTRADSVQDNETTGLYLDETPIAINGANPDFALFDVERIEVQRGPQGTLYGAGAMAGNIRIVTKQPDVHKTEATVQAFLSDTKHGDVNYGTDLVVNLPLIDDKLALRLVGYHHFSSGYFDNVAPIEATVGDYHNINNLDDIGSTPGSEENANSEELYGGRLALKWLATDDFSLALNLIGQKRELGGRFNTNETSDPRFNFSEYDQFRVTKERMPENNYIANLTMDWNVGWGDLVSSTSYTTRDWNQHSDLTLLMDIVFGCAARDATAAAGGDPSSVLLPEPHCAPVSPISNDAHVDDFVQEVRISGKAFNRLDWIGGAFYSTRNREFLQRLPSPGFEALVRSRGGAYSDFTLTDYGSKDAGGDYDYVIDLDQEALFGELTYGFTDRLSATAGARWYHTKTQSDIFFRGLLNGGVVREVNDVSEDGVNPKFQVSYKFSDDVLVFATAAQGYRVGGTNEVIPDTPTCQAELASIGITSPPIGFDSDSLWSYELGAKTQFMDRRLTLNGSVYHIDWSDIQATRLLHCGFSFRDNAGKAKVDGVELEISGQPTENLFFSVGGAYTNSRLAEDSIEFAADAGDHMPLIPKYNGSAMMQYGFPMGTEARGFVNFSVTYTGEQFTGFEERGHKLDSFAIGDLRLGMEKNNWQISLFVDNLWDEHARTLVQDSVFRFPAGTETNWTRPQTIGMSIRADF